MADTIPQESAQRQPSVIERGIRIAAYPLTAVIGGYYGWVGIRNTSYNNLSKSGAKKGGIFQEEYKIREDAAQKLIDDGVKGEEYFVKKAAIDKAYSIASKRTAAEKGYASILTRFKSLHHSQRMDIALTIFTAAGVTLGVMLTLADNKSLQKLFAKKEQKEKDGAPDISK